jgi:hypothetical protein
MTSLGQDFDSFKQLHGKFPIRTGDEVRRASLAADYKKMYRRLGRQQREINEALSRYIFRPTLTYEIITDTRGQGLIPDQRGFRMQVGESTLLEADVVISLVRLYRADELFRVRLCIMCKKRWLVASKSHYQFCSGECREAYYTNSPDYNERRAKIQREYRKRLKFKYCQEDKLSISRLGDRHAKS